MLPQRIVARAPATLTHRFSDPGLAGVSVTVTAADGTAVLDAAAATQDGTDPAVWTVDVPATALPGPTALTVEWDAGGGWVESEVVEVAGGRYLTPDDIRGDDAAGTGMNRDRFTDALLERAIVVVERRIEKATGVAWVPRYEQTELVPIDPVHLILRPRPREILTAVYSDGTIIDPAGWGLSPTGIVTRTWGTFRAGVHLVVGYLHGHDTPPSDLADAARDAATSLAKGDANNRLPSTATSVDGLGVTFNFSHQADLKRGRPFGLPDVDAVVMSHAIDVPAVA